MRRDRFEGLGNSINSAASTPDGGFRASCLLACRLRAAWGCAHASPAPLLCRSAASERAPSPAPPPVLPSDALSASSPQTARRRASSTMENGGAIVPVGVAKTALPEALVTQTKAIGVILPPPDIRAIVDKTVRGLAAPQRRWSRAAAARPPPPPLPPPPQRSLLPLCPAARC